MNKNFLEIIQISQNQAIIGIFYKNKTIFFYSTKIIDEFRNFIDKEGEEKFYFITTRSSFLLSFFLNKLTEKNEKIINYFIVNEITYFFSIKLGKKLIFFINIDKFLNIEFEQFTKKKKIII